MSDDIDIEALFKLPAVGESKKGDNGGESYGVVLGVDGVIYACSGTLPPGFPTRHADEGQAVADFAAIIGKVAARQVFRHFGVDPEPYNPKPDTQ